MEKLSEEYNIPSGYYYTREHLWIKPEDNVIVVGVTDYGQKKLRDVVNVELPSMGQTIEAVSYTHLTLPTTERV